MIAREQLCSATAEAVRFQYTAYEPVCHCILSDDQVKTGLPVRVGETVNGTASSVNAADENSD